jgi:hypothetical protein
MEKSISMSRRFLALALILILLVGACGKPAPAPTSALIVEPALELVGFMQGGFGMRGLVREGYLVPVEPDLLARRCPNSSLAQRRVRGYNTGDRGVQTI